MKSHEVLKLAADGVGVKALAAELKLSPALVYKWCQESSRDEVDASGAINPLDRLVEIVRITGNDAVVRWLCQQAGGFFVINPPPASKPARRELLEETQKLVHEFSRLLTTVTRSIEDDGFIDGREAERIRASWEHLKSTAEEFAVASERGVYSRPAAGR